MKTIIKFATTLAIVVALGFGSTANAFTIGQRGQDVVELQAKLIENGYDIPAITTGGAALGYFGYQTQAALAASEATVTASPLKLGAGSGEFYGPFTGLNNVKTIANQSFLKNATTTPCSFVFTATSSLSFFSVQVASTSAQATIYDLATSTSPNATTSLITQFSTNISNVGANAKASLVWNGDQTQVGTISPGTFLVLGVRGVTGGSPGGSCQYEAKIF